MHGWLCWAPRFEDSDTDEKVEYGSEDDGNDMQEKQKQKEIKEMEDDFSGDDEDYEEVRFPLMDWSW